MDSRAALFASLKAWLSSEAGRRHLLLLAKQSAREAARGGGLAAVWPYPRLAELSPAERQDTLQDIADDFLVHLLETLPARLERRPELIHDLLDGRWHHVLDDSWRRFLGQWQEKSRSLHDNPRGYLYRRARMTVGSDPRFLTLTQAGALAYALAAEPPRQPAVLPSERIPFAALAPPPLPRTTSRHKTIFTPSFLALAAMQLYRQIAWGGDGPGYIAVRDLTEHLAHAFPWLNLPRREDAGEEVEQHPSSALAPEDRAEYRESLTSIHHLAEQLTANWQPRACQALLWHLDDAKPTLQDMATILGLKDHNAAHRLLRGVVRDMRRFVASTPGPGWHDLPEEVTLAFVAAVKTHCEKKLALPVQESK
ncbi:MAG: hypothetical protein BWK76_06725 [Desulfobulbaceae bacterium A2]|nr:MAG: hypothetical protein BWK76_06725 [Desulfobulbaceae bacterium A2]